MSNSKLDLPHKPNVLIVGGGAIGAMHGARLQEAGANVAVVCRSNLAVVSERGYRIESRQLGSWTFVPSAGAYASPSDAVAALAKRGDGTKLFDYVIVTTKVLPEISDDSELIAPAVSSGRSLIVLIQNGVGIEESHAARFPSNAVASAVTYMAASQVSDGEIAHSGHVDLAIGLVCSPDPERDRQMLERLSEMLRAGGLPATVHENVQTVRWHKLVWNAVFGPLCILAGCVDTATLLSSPSMVDLVKAAMSEVVSAASVVIGRDLPADTIENYIVRTRMLAAYRPSMLLDFEKNRPLETRAVLANAIRMASNRGASMPLATAFLALLEMRVQQRK